MEKHPLHLKNPELQKSPEVTRAVERQERHTGEYLPNDPAERIEAYTDRLENIFLNPDKRVRERNLELFRDQVYDALIIKPEQFPESYFELQQRVARERGQAVETIPENVREQMKAVAIEDQKHSLDAWINYLSSDDAVYPAWFKYFVWKNVTKLSQFDKERGEFKKRTDTTVAPFPDIYREPLAQIADIYEKVKEDNKNLKETEVKEAFSKKFPALYAELIQKSLAASMESREEVRGQWVKYEQGDDSAAEKLFESLEGKGTGWCTAGRSTAETQIDSGDFYVFYTNDTTGTPSQPRLAIRMDGDNKIGEVRGILPHQNIEPQMQEVLDEKLTEFGSEADAYRKKSEDMKTLTALEQKQEKNEPFTKDELIFLYEINTPIEGFGYDRDPRIDELRGTRNAKEDAPVVLGCAPEEIAWRKEDVGNRTKAYIGPLFAGIFDSGIEHILTSFPEGNIPRYSVELGGKSKEQLQAELEQKNISITQWAEDLLKSKDFITSSTPESTDLVRLTVEDLGFPQGATTDQIYARAGELGLDLCPAEVGPQLRLSYTGNDWMYIAMKQITDRDGDPDVFSLREGAGELELYADCARPDGRWHSGIQFVFRLRKKLSSSGT